MLYELEILFSKFLNSSHNFLYITIVFDRNQNNTLTSANPHFNDLIKCLVQINMVY